jgi:phage-related minor tail protein
MVFDLLARDRASSEVGKVGDSMDKAGDHADALGDKVGGMFGKLAGVAAGAGLAVGASFVSMLESQGANRLTTAQLGLDPAESAAAGKLAGELYAGNYGDSLEGVNEAVGAVASSITGLGDMGSDQMQTATRDALNFATAFGTDVGESAQIAGGLIKNGLAADATEAFDLMTAGFQQVPAAMREELPAILTEYGTNFRALGYTGEQSMALLVDAAAQGPFVLDKMGDALKEFTIRGTDMSKASTQAYEAIGLSADDMAAKLVAGGPAAQEATQQVAAGLLGIEDPVARANNAIALFGTPLEDLSVDQIPAFLNAISMQNGELENVAGTAAALDTTLSTGIGHTFETLKRGAQQAATEGMGALIAGFTQGKTDGDGWQGTLQNLSAAVSGVLQPALGGASSFVTGTVLPALGSLFDFLTTHQTTVTVIAGLISGVLAAAFLVWGTRAIMAAGQNALAWLSVVTSSNTGAAASSRSALQVVARWVFMGAQSLLQAARMAAAWVIALGPIGWATAAVIAIVALVIANWDKVKAFTGKAWSAVSGAVKTAAGAVKDAAKAAIDFVVNLFLNFTGPGLLIKHWDTIKTKTREAWDAVWGAVSGAWSKVTGAVSDGVSTAVTFVKELPGKVVSSLGNLGSTLYGAGSDLISGLINGAKSLLSNIGRTFLNIVPGWIRGPFEKALGISSPSKVFAQYGRFIGDGLIVGIGAKGSEVTKAGRDLAGFVRGGFANTIDGTVAEAQAGIKDLNAKVLAAAKEGNTMRLAAAKLQNTNALESVKKANAGALAAVTAENKRATDAASKTLDAARERARTAAKGQAKKDADAAVRAATAAKKATSAQNADRLADVKKANAKALDWITGSNKRYVTAIGKQNAAALTAAGKFGQAVARADDQLLNLAKQREAVAKQLEAARDRLNDAVKLRNDYRTAIGDAARQYANVTSIKTGGSSAVLVDDLRTRLAAITAFRTKLGKLAKLGLSDEVYKQIADAGVEQGSATADALLSGGAAAVKQVNTLSGQIVKQSTGLGTDAARELYQAGVDAATGLVNGLSSKSKKLTQAAEHLADQLTAAVKKKLGIKSPSRVFAGIGNNIGQGLADGIGAMRPVVASELAALADSAAFEQLQTTAGIDVGAGGSSGLGYRAPRYDPPTPPAAPASSTRTVNVSGVVGPEQVAALVRREQTTDEFLAGAGT